MKKYTALRKFYAWVGFLTLIALTIVGVQKVSHAINGRDVSLMQNQYCHEVLMDGTEVTIQC